MVLVFADGEWREWTHHYARFEECEEVKQTILHRREDKIAAVCEAKLIKKD